MAKKYIYHRDDWPELAFDQGAIGEALSLVYLTQGKLFGKLDALGFDVQNKLLLGTVSDEIMSSFEIEGERLNVSGVRSSVARRLGLENAGLTTISPDHYTEGVVEMALEATQNYSASLTDERLFGWHAALFPTGRSGIHRIVAGGWRPKEIEIVYGPLGHEKVHFRGPAPERVPSEMKYFLEWLEGGQNIDPFVKAGLAHLRFEAIHPFEDGNGRIGRAIADLQLARAEKTPYRYYSLSSQFLKERKAYYSELESATKFSGDATMWLIWFLGSLVRAMKASEAILEKAKEKARYFEKWKNISINERQLKIVNMLLDGFEGKLTTSKWAKLCKCSHDTALRDIENLIGKKVLARSKEGGRSTSYDLI